jgi:hypothetical protein
MTLPLKLFSLKKALIILILAGTFLKAQDTIRFRNGDLRSGKVTEITTEDIKYLRPEAPSEPPYVIKRSGIYLIKYQNGQIDTFTTREPKKVAALSNPPEQKVVSREGKIVIKKLDLIYQTELVNDRKLKDMIDKNTSGEKKNLLLTEYKKIKTYQMAQYNYNVLGWAGFTLAFAGGSAAAIGDDNGLIFASGLGLGIGSIVTGAIMSKQLKMKRLKQRVKVAQIYNDEYEFK